MHTIKGVQEAQGGQWVADKMYQICARCKQGFDSMMKELGGMKQRWLASVLREEIQEGKRVCLYIRSYQEYGGVRGDQRNCHDGSIGKKLMRATQIISTNKLKKFGEILNEGKLR